MQRAAILVFGFASIGSLRRSSELLFGPVTFGARALFDLFLRPPIGFFAEGRKGFNSSNGKDDGNRRRADPRRSGEPPPMFPKVGFRAATPRRINVCVTAIRPGLLHRPPTFKPARDEPKVKGFCLPQSWFVRSDARVQAYAQ